MKVWTNTKYFGTYKRTRHYYVSNLISRSSAWKYLTQNSLYTGSCSFYDSFRASLKHTKSTPISTFAQLTLWHTIKLEIFATNKPTLVHLFSLWPSKYSNGSPHKELVKSTQYKKLAPNALWFTCLIGLMFKFEILQII